MHNNSDISSAANIEYIDDNTIDANNTDKMVTFGFEKWNYILIDKKLKKENLTTPEILNFLYFICIVPWET